MVFRLIVRGQLRRGHTTNYTGHSTRNRANLYLCITNTFKIVSINTLHNQNLCGAQMKRKTIILIR